MDIIYPVGCVYISYTSVSPAVRFGGTWSAITGRFPYFNAGIGTGGSNTHSHVYGVAARDYWNAATSLALYNNGSSWIDKYSRIRQGASGEVNSALVNSTSEVTTRELFGGTANTSTTNGAPAYQTLYAWRRTA